MRIPIIIYDDNPDFGGHQIMASHAVEALAGEEDLKPIFYLNPDNHKLKARLETISSASGNLEIRSTEFKTRKLQGLRNHFCRSGIAKLRRSFASESPRLILCIQGEIEDSSQAVLAAVGMSVDCLSYIPIPHRMSLMGAKLGALRDRLNQYLLNKPDGYITISPSMAEILRSRGVERPVEIVYNGIDSERFEVLPQNEARLALGLPMDCEIIGMAGRIEFKQKQHKLLIESMHSNPDLFAGLHLAILGDGPDEARLADLIKRYAMGNRVTMIPWLDNPDHFYSAIDFLILPSRYEGVPLVMLEALCFGVPVVGSNRDGMKDVLPERWLFPTESSQGLAESLEYVRRHGKEDLERLRNWVLSEMTIASFKKNFIAKVRGWIS